MKKNSLTTAVIAGLAGVAGLAGMANAVNLNPDGIGQVLLYPYYTTNGDNTTLITVVNTADVSKAVKVRFLEALNSKEVLDFNVYMSPWDVWTAAVHLNAAGEPGITTTDQTCVVPKSVMGSFTKFRDFEFRNWTPDYLGVEGPGVVDAAVKNETRKLQGHLEVIEMGDLSGDPHHYALASSPAAPFAERCDYFQTQWNTKGNVLGQPTWLLETGGEPDEPNLNRGLHDVNPPGSGFVDAAGVIQFNDVGGPGGIFGSAYIVNANEGTSYSYNAEAINGFYTIGAAMTGAAQDDNLHYAPGSIWPSLSQAANDYDVNTAEYFAYARVFDPSGNPADLAFETSGAPEAVSAVLMARYVVNEFNIDGAGKANSDWVVTFPTKMLHTYRSPAGGLPGVVNGLAPFSMAQGAGALNAIGDNVFDGYWPEAYEIEYWDREERSPIEPPGVIDVSPLPPPGEKVQLAFGAEANVLTFQRKGTAEDEDKSVLHPKPGSYGGGYTLGVENGFDEGWARVGFATQSLTSLPAADNPEGYGERTLYGLPVIGFWASRHVNAAAGANNITAYYNLTHRHRVVRDIE